MVFIGALHFAVRDAWFECPCTFPQIIHSAGEGTKTEVDLTLQEWEVFYARPSTSATKLLDALRLSASHLRQRLAQHRADEGAARTWEQLEVMWRTASQALSAAAAKEADLRYAYPQECDKYAAKPYRTAWRASTHVR